jgi:acetyl esterase/lipase
MNDPRMSALRAALGAVGASMNAADTVSLYLPHHAGVLPADVRIVRDMRYGPFERNLLDIAAPERSGALRPVLVFVHGGGFTGGERQRAGTPFYDNVMLWALARGFVGINITYRLAPDAKWPAGGVDVALALDWIAQNAGAYAGDPARLIVFGHSAGAAHVAEALAQQGAGKRQMAPLAGAVLLSGLYEPATAAPSAGRRAYFGDDPGLYPERGALAGLAKTKVPLRFLAAELEPREFIEQADSAFDAIRRAHCTATIEHIPAHNHFSTVFSLGSDDSSFAEKLHPILNDLLAQSR